jgi:outer membrane protein
MRPKRCGDSGIHKMRSDLGGFPAVMRHALTLIAILALMAAAIPARAEMKLAYVDVQRALNQCDAGKKAKAEFQSRVETVKSRLERQQDEVQSLKDQLEKKGMLMSADQRQSLSDQYTSKLKDFERAYKDAQDELQGKDQEITAKIVHDLAQVIRTLGEREGYTIVMEKGSILWGAPSIDITDQVIRTYNASHVPIGTLGEGGGSSRSSSFGESAAKKSSISK